MSEYDDWKQENDRWEAYLYPNGVLRNKLGITKAAKWHKMERDFGTTSAHAENTAGKPRGSSLGRNYLRARGEYKSSLKSSAPSQELPPHARRIQLHATGLPRLVGTTSTCAENTGRLHYFH